MARERDSGSGIRVVDGRSCSGSRTPNPEPRTRPRGTLPLMFNSRSVRLGLMMFLNYVIWGAWYVTISTYLTRKPSPGFSGIEAGAVFGTTALASMISPFFVGLIADRFFATERVMAVLYLIGAVLLFSVTLTTSFGAVYGLMLAYCICYFPTIAMTNTLVFK